MLAVSEAKVSMWPFIKSAIRSRVGHLLVVTHLCLVVGYFAPLEPVAYFYEPNPTVRAASFDEVITGRFIGGRYMDFESAALRILVPLNVLPLLMSQAVTKCFILLLPQLSVHALSWIHAFLLVALSSVQWLCVGYFIEKMFKLYKSSS